MKTIAVTIEEGGAWIATRDWDGRYVKDHPGFHPNKGILVHSIKFEDGSIWDANNGFRKRRYDSNLGEYVDV
jgi:hypothetical protein